MFLASVRSMFCKPRTRRHWFSLAATAGMVCAVTVGASVAMTSQASVTMTPEASMVEIHQLMEQGKTKEAAQRVQAALKHNSNDVHLRFLQGIVAAEQRKYSQAIQVFTALSQDYPALPEPYNNLAVLYAAKGEDDKAAQVLEQAIRTNPSYATAHKNMGDLYASMASDAYAKALQLEGGSQAAQPKLSLITSIYPATASHTQLATQATAPTPAPALASAPVATPPAKAPAPQPTAPAPAQVPHAVNAPQVAALAKPAVLAPQPAPEPVAEPKPADESKQAVAAVNQVVASWAKAWEQQNMNAYYAVYSNQFEPQSGTLAAWKIERKNRIVGKPAISVEVRNLKVSIKGARATANFRQHYTSGGYKATTRKTLQLQREGDKWRITREGTGG